MMTITLLGTSLLSPKFIFPHTSIKIVETGALMVLSSPRETAYFRDINVRDQKDTPRFNQMDRNSEIPQYQLRRSAGNFSQASSFRMRAQPTQSYMEWTQIQPYSPSYQNQTAATISTIRRSKSHSDSLEKQHFNPTKQLKKKSAKSSQKRVSYV